MNYIKNYTELASTDLRKDTLDIIEAGYSAIDTSAVIKNKIKLSGAVLTIQGNSYDLNNYNKVYIIGAGKVACQAAIELENILEKFINDGAVVGIKEKVCQIVTTYVGTHPLPSEQNYKASEHIEKVSKKANEDDLVLAIIGGGGSALLCSSIDEYKQNKSLYEAFLDTGGTIEELNIVRKHISRLKGGGLAELLYPATVVGLIFSDIPGDDCSIVASGPTFKDETNIADAQTIIDKYNLGDFTLTETPKEDKYFKKIKNITLVSNNTALEEMKNKAQSLGYKTKLAGSDIYGFPKETATLLQKEVAKNTVVIAGGETKLVIPTECDGVGGRNDFLALEMVSHLRENQVFSSFASDGKDNTEAAGAIVDNSTKEKIVSLKIDVAKHKKCLDSFTLLKQTDDLLITGPIEANVSDLMVLLTK